MKKYKVEKVKIISDNHKMKMLIISPKDKRTPEHTPGVLWLHGGGYMLGSAKMAFFSRAIDLVTECGAVLLVPNYRLSLKHPYPKGLIDCYNALLYLKENSEKLRINKNQIMVGGESAGGGLTCAVTILAREKKEVNIAYQMPLYPMIDCEETSSNKDNHAPVWNTTRNKFAWKKYLKNVWGEVPSYASPSRLTDYSNLPPAYTFVGDIEPFYCETLDYIKKLNEAKVEASCDVYPNCFHAFDMLLPKKKASIEARKKFIEKFRYAQKHYFKEND